MSDTIKFGKHVNLSKEDPLKRPRHQVQHTCSDFEECPLCYKCRAYNSALYKCRNCDLYKEGMLCKKDKHTVKVLEMMIRRERIDLDENV